MNFEVEDGTSKTNATSYVTVAEFRSYWEDRSVNVEAFNDTDVQGYLNAATEYIDATYDFVGTPTDTDQALSWPRYITSQTGLQRKVIDSDDIPQEIKNAVNYLAYEASKGKTALFEIDKGVVSESYGGISKTYNKSGDKGFPYLDKMLTKYLVIAGTPLQRVN